MVYGLSGIALKNTIFYNYMYVKYYNNILYLPYQNQNSKF